MLDIWSALCCLVQLCFIRVAVVSVRNPDDAEAAVREMNGQSIQGHTLYVEHLHKPPADGQVNIKESCGQLVDRAPAAHKTGSVGKWLIPQSSNNNFRASRVSITQDIFQN